MGGEGGTIPAEGFPLLSPRKGRGGEEMIGNGKRTSGRERGRPCCIAIRMPGLVEVAAGMGLTGGIVDDGIDDDDDDKRNTVSFLVLPGLHSTFVVANPFHILTHVSNG